MPAGYVDYKKREYCNDIKCPVQLALNVAPPDSEVHGAIRNICSAACLRTSDEFRQWLAARKFIFLDSHTRAPVERKKLDEIARENATTWRFHHRTMELGMLLVKPGSSDSGV